MNASEQYRSNTGDAEDKTSMEFDITSLQAEFDNLLPATDEEQQMFWLNSVRDDEIVITLIISRYEQTATLIVRYPTGDITTALSLTDCNSVKVLDGTVSGIIEVICAKPSLKIRCLLSLRGQNLVQLDME